MSERERERASEWESVRERERERDRRAGNIKSERARARDVLDRFLNPNGSCQSSV